MYHTLTQKVMIVISFVTCHLSRTEKRYGCNIIFYDVILVQQEEMIVASFVMMSQIQQILKHTCVNNIMHI